MARVEKRPYVRHIHRAPLHLIAPFPLAPRRQPSRPPVSSITPWALKRAFVLAVAIAPSFESSLAIASFASFATRHEGRRKRPCDRAARGSSRQVFALSLHARRVERGRSFPRPAECLNELRGAQRGTSIVHSIATAALEP